jgi:hypothetical protein
MDHINVVKRAFQTTWRYRALWVFGILIALTSGGGGNGGGGSYGGSGNGGRSSDFPFPKEFSLPGASSKIADVLPGILASVAGALVPIIIGLVCLALFLTVVAMVIRYVATTALIRMVDDHEETGEKRGVRWGLNQGWSRSAWRLFLIDLLITLPTVVIFIVLFALALSPLLLWTTGDEAAGAIGTVITLVTVIPLGLLAIVVGIVLTVLNRFFRRACALEGLGVMDSIRQGYTLARGHIGDTLIMWLIMLGLGIAWIIVVIPVTILVLVLALAAGGLPALAVGWLASMSLEGAWPYIIGAAIGLPIFVVVMVVPLTFLGGLVEVFKSSIWTLTYRELRTPQSA